MNSKKNAERHGCGLIKALVWFLPEGNEGNKSKLQSGEPVSRPRFKLNTSQIQVQNTVTTIALLDKGNLVYTKSSINGNV
jgi:hypothetical protein